MKKTEIQKEKSRRTVRGELALMVAVAINSLGVVLMLHSGAGISAISSVPYRLEPGLIYFRDFWC